MTEMTAEEYNKTITESMSEHERQSQFFSLIALNPNYKWVYAVPNGFFSTPRQKNKMKQEGLRPGVFDVCFPCPRGKYHGAYIEFKVDKGKLRPEQKKFGEYITDQGYMAAMAYSADEALEILDTYWELGNGRL